MLDHIPQIKFFESENIHQIKNYSPYDLTPNQWWPHPRRNSRREQIRHFFKCTRIHYATFPDCNSVKPPLFLLLTVLALRRRGSSADRGPRAHPATARIPARYRTLNVFMLIVVFSLFVHLSIYHSLPCGNVPEGVCPRPRRTSSPAAG